jgi:uncharacterized membrane protein YfcA
MAICLGMIVGLALGLTGGGGSIFAVPLLIHGLGLAPREAIDVSLVAVASTAAFGAVGALRVHMIEYRAGLVFASGGLLAAPLGVRWGRYVSPRVTLIAFALLMVLVALRMWLTARRDPAQAVVVRADFVLDGDERRAVCRLQPDERLHLTAPCSAALVVAGIGTGVLAGFFGVGGGFVIVPALTFLSQMSIHRAVATSLFVIALVASSAAGSALSAGHQLSWSIAAWFTAGGLLGMRLGRVLARRLAGPTLQQVFAGAILVVAVVVLLSRA